MSTSNMFFHAEKEKYLFIYSSYLKLYCFVFCLKNTFEPPLENANKRCVQPAKAQVSLCFCAV